VKIFRQNKAKNKKIKNNYFSKRKNTSKTIKPIKFFLSILFLALLLSFYQVMNRPIEIINLNGDFKRVSKKVVQQKISNINGQGYLNFNLKEVKLEIESISWVQLVTVERKWPDTIDITIFEDDVVGLWNDQLVLNSSGKVFDVDKRTIPSNLIKFYGPEGTNVTVFERYNIFYKELVARGLILESMTYSLLGSWSFVIRPRVEIKLGKSNLSERFDRFLLVWDESLLDNYDQISYIDFRYTEGFAIKRK
jgi:cell division protein FtsQ